MFPALHAGNRNYSLTLLKHPCECYLCRFNSVVSSNILNSGNKLQVMFQVTSLETGKIFPEVTVFEIFFSFDLAGKQCPAQWTECNEGSYGYPAGWYYIFFNTACVQ